MKKKVYNMPKMRMVTLATEHLLTSSDLTKVGVSTDFAITGLGVLSKTGGGFIRFTD